MHEIESGITPVELVFVEVDRLYANAKASHAKWMYRHHLPVVDRFIKEICSQYGINYPRTAIAGRLHDLGDALGVDRDSSYFDEISLAEARKILDKLGFPPGEIDYIVDNIIATHSCRPGKMPVSAEGEALAGGDSLAHLFSDFYVMKPRRAFFSAKEREKWRGYKRWAYEKVKQDYYVKLGYFPELQAAAKGRFEELVQRYG